MTPEFLTIFVQFITKFHNHAGCTEYLHDFLNLISMDMLHITPHSPNVQSRIDIRGLDIRLLGLRTRCNGKEYALKSASWDQKHSKKGSRSYAEVVKA